MKAVKKMSDQYQMFFPFDHTLEYLINVYDQFSVYGGNLGFDTHRVGTYLGT